MKDWVAGLTKLASSVAMWLTLAPEKSRLWWMTRSLRCSAILLANSGVPIGEQDVLQVALEGLLEVDLGAGQLGIDLLLSQGVQCIVMGGIEAETEDVVVAQGSSTILNDRVVKEQGTGDEEGDLQLSLDGFEEGGGEIHIKSIKDRGHMSGLHAAMVGGIAGDLDVLGIVIAMGICNQASGQHRTGQIGQGEAAFREGILGSDRGNKQGS